MSTERQSLTILVLGFEWLIIDGRSDGSALIMRMFVDVEGTTLTKEEARYTTHTRRETVTNSCRVIRHGLEFNCVDPTKSTVHEDTPHVHTSTVHTPDSTAPTDCWWPDYVPEFQLNYILKLNSIMLGPTVQEFQQVNYAVGRVKSPFALE